MNSPITQKFKNLGNITTPYGGQTKDEPVHPAIDFANRAGTPIPAFANGTIVKTGFSPDGFGNNVIMKDNNGDVHQYSHLSKFKVKPGQKVKKGQEIAKMGSSGNSYSPSGGDPSHLDIRIASKYGKWKNPMLYINKI